MGAAAPAPAAAQELDAGQLQVNENGRRVGVERFRIWRAGSTVNARQDLIVQLPRRVPAGADAGADSAAPGG